MAKRKVIGICNICGVYGELTAEHVPPQKAFNDKRVLKMPFRDAISLRLDATAKGVYEQGGVKVHTLCGKCNNNTGVWYAKDFIDWCCQAAEILLKTDGRPSLIYMYHAMPLRIIKQIAVMFLAIGRPTFAEKNPELVDFVLAKNRKYLPDNYKFYVYYNLGGRLRYSAVSGLLDISKGQSSVFSEIAFPPFGYVLTLGTPPPDRRLFEITHFAEYAYNEYSYIQLRPPVLPTHLAKPGDYRTKDEIAEDARSGEELLKNNEILMAYDQDQTWQPDIDTAE